MKNIILVGVMVLGWSWSVVGNATDPLDGINKEHADKIIGIASGTSSSIIGMHVIVLEILNDIPKKLNISDLPERDYLDNYGISIGKIVASELASEFVSDIPIVGVIPDLFETIYGFAEAEREYNEAVKTLKMEEVIVLMIDDAKAKLEAKLKTSDDLKIEMAKEYKNLKTIKEQEKYLKEKQLEREWFNNYFNHLKKSKSWMELTYLEGIIRGLHDLRLEKEGFVIVEADWSKCTFSFDEWTEVHNPNFCTPENISISFQGVYGKKIMKRLNVLMKFNGIQSILDLKIDVYTKLKVKIGRCTDCELGFHIPHHLRTTNLIPDEMTMQNLGFKKGSKIPSRSLIPLVNSRPTEERHEPCDYSCKDLSADEYGAALVHAGLWFIRNKNREEFKRFTLN